MEGILIIIATAYIFYENILAALVLSPYIYLHFKESRKIEEKKRRLKAACEFKDGIMSVAFSLSVGYSIENSFAEATIQLKSLYGKDSEIVQEFELIVNRLAQNENLEDILDEYADKSNVEDIKYFAEVFRYAKRSGGDILSVIRNTAMVIKEKADVNSEVETILSGKRMEQKVMSIIPFGIILYLKLTARGFISALYGNIMGAFIMTMCLCAYVLADQWAKRIVNIEV